jgi:streptomycin 6-kinase
VLGAPPSERAVRVIKLLLAGVVHVGHDRLVPTVSLPEGVLAFAERGPEWAAFVDRLPRVFREVAEEWGLTVDGEPGHGHGSLVVPVSRDGVPAVLKLAFPDDEGEHEALGLQRLGGDGAVRLLGADPHRWALLLERLHPTDLDSLPVLDACEVVAGLYPRLHVPAPPQLRSVTSYLDRWTPALRALPRDAPVPHRLVEQTLSLVADLFADDGAGVLLHGDLHYQNVLAADREPWLVIDPKPMRGDPHYEPAPMLWNRWEEAVDTGNLRFALRRRFHAIVDAAGLDEGLARDWVVVRMVYNAIWELEDHPTAPDREWLTRCVTTAKAVQD